LSLCGIGVLDESEIDSAVVGGRVDVDPDTGEIQTDLRHDALAEAEPGARPPGEPDPEADVLLGKIQAGFDMLKVRAPEQAELWRSFCGQAAFMTTTADVASLGQLYDHLAARYRDEVKGKK
jgi:hypothetical protein